MIYLSTIFFHWLCDFIIQGSDLAVSKLSRYRISHILSYSLSFPVCMAFVSMFNYYCLEQFVFLSLGCVLSHAIIDWYIIPILHKYYKLKNRRKVLYFLFIDQVLHIACIILFIRMFIQPWLL